MPLPFLNQINIFPSPHTNTSALVWRVANKANELELQCVIPVHVTNLTVRPVINIIAAGYRKPSLAKFNKNIVDMKQGKPSQPEANEITSCQVVEHLDADDSARKLSALHKH